MTEFPSNLHLPPLATISTTGFGSMACDLINNGAASGSAGAWSLANRALFYPIAIEVPFLAQKMACYVTATAAGNIDLGIYDMRGNRLVSSGATAVGGVGLQVLDITDTLLLPGTYFIAMVCDTVTTVTFQRITTGLYLLWAAGGSQMTSAYPLPNPATWVPVSTGYIPCVTVSGVPYL